MRLLEYQSRQLLGEFGIPFTQATVVSTPDAASVATENLDAAVMLKAQVPFGGRGKQGAVVSAETPQEAADQAHQLLGRELNGTKVTQISVETKVSFQREMYLGVAWDTARKKPVALVSLDGGMEVEASRERVVRQVFDPWQGLMSYQGREMAVKIGLTGKAVVAVGRVLEQLAAAFLKYDALLIEINPLVELFNGDVVGLDAHFEIEGDAAYRQRARLERLGTIFSSPTGRPPTALELEAERIDAMDHRGVAGRVVEFEGSLALLIGGGGASLTVFDAVLKYGGKPANYSEIGGNPTAEKVAALTRLLLSKPGVDRLAVVMNVVNNTRADIVAQGVVEGVNQAGLKPSEVLSVFRVPGSWEEEARQILADVGVVVQGREVSLDECARLAVADGGAAVKTSRAPTGQE